MNPIELQAYFQIFTDPHLLQALLDKGQLMHLGTRKGLDGKPGQFVKMVPIILEGSIKILKEWMRREKNYSLLFRSGKDNVPALF